MWLVAEPQLCFLPVHSTVVWLGRGSLTQSLNFTAEFLLPHEASAISYLLQWVISGKYLQCRNTWHQTCFLSGHFLEDAAKSLKCFLFHLPWAWHWIPAWLSPKDKTLLPPGSWKLITNNPKVWVARTVLMTEIIPIDDQDLFSIKSSSTNVFL